jgi:DNA-binding beta-propeller fold protein YncE
MTHRGISILASSIAGALLLISSSSAAVEESGVGHFAYVSNTSDGTASIIDIASGKMLKTIRGFSSDPPLSVATNALTTEVYLGSQSAIYYMNANGAGGVSSISAPSGFKKLVFGAAGRLLYFNDYSGQSLDVIDTRTHQITNKIGLCLAKRRYNTCTQPAAVALDPVRPYAFVTDPFNGLLGVVDLNAAKEVQALASGTYQPIDVYASPNGKLLYVVGIGSIAVFSLPSQTLLGTVPTQNGLAYGQMAFSHDGRFAYLVNTAGGYLEIRDAFTLMILKSVPVGQNPNDVAIDATGTRAAVTVTSQNALSIVDLLHGSVTGTISTGASPRAFGAFIRTLPQPCTGSPAHLDVVPSPESHWTAATIAGYSIVGPTKQHFLVRGFDCTKNQVQVGELHYKLVGGSHITLQPVSGKPEFFVQASLPSHGALLTISTTGGSPVSETIHIDASPAVYVQKQPLGGVGAFDDFGNGISLAPGAFQKNGSYADLVYNPSNGDLYASDEQNGVIDIWSPDGTLQGTIADPNVRQPVGLAFDPHTDYLYVTNPAFNGPPDKPSITIFDTHGKNVTLPGSFAAVAKPWGIRYNASNGLFYVTDGKLNQIQVYRPDGTLVGRHTSHVSGPFAFDIDPLRNDLYLVDFNAGVITILGPDFKVKKSFGSMSLQSPSAVTFDTLERRVYVVDYTNVGNFAPLVQEFTPTGVRLDLGISGNFGGAPKSSSALAIIP